MGIELHIEELVLHGFAAKDRHRIAEAVRLELTRLVGAQGLPDLVARTRAVHALNGGGLEIKKGGGPEAAGQQIAQATYRCLQASATPSAAGRLGTGGPQR